MWLTKCAFIFLRTSAGASSQSTRFCSGNITCLSPKRDAASTFSLIPPTRITRPRRLISPVIAKSDLTRRRITESDLRWAHVIFVMEREHKTLIQERFPDVEFPRIEVLDVLDDFEVMDPELQEMLRLTLEAEIKKLLESL
jgi:predicted protein tyrosine phosphatase